MKEIEDILGEKMTEEFADFEYKTSIEDEEVIKEGRLTRIANAKKLSEMEMGASGENEVFEKLRKRKDDFREAIKTIRQERQQKNPDSSKQAKKDVVKKRLKV